MYIYMYIYIATLLHKIYRTKFINSDCDLTNYYIEHISQLVFL